MRCSKCWARKKCLDAGHRDGVGCAAIEDRPCRAMRAVMKMARKISAGMDSISRDRPACEIWERMCVGEKKCQRIGKGDTGPCPECLARWATR